MKESVGGEMRERGILVSKVVLWLMLIEIFWGVKMKKIKTLMVITVNFPNKINKQPNKRHNIGVLKGIVILYL